MCFCIGVSWKTSQASMWISPLVITGWSVVLRYYFSDRIATLRFAQHIKRRCTWQPNYLPVRYEEYVQTLHTISTHSNHLNAAKNTNTIVCINAK